MSRWYQVFDDERVNMVTRTAARRHATAAGALVVLSAAAVLPVLDGWVSAYPVVTLLAGLWGWAGAAVIRSWRGLRRQVWCVKISDREIVGYDYRRKRIRVDWIDARQVDVNRRGLAVSGARDVRLEVPIRFPDYTDLCNSVLGYADFYEVPILVDGRELASVQANELFPFLDQLDPSD